MARPGWTWRGLGRMRLWGMGGGGASGGGGGWLTGLGTEEGTERLGGGGGAGGETCLPRVRDRDCAARSHCSRVCGATRRLSEVVLTRFGVS